MPFTFNGAITGGAQAGLTTPGYNLTQDSQPSNNGKQAVVSALTGTQAGVAVHSVSAPFTVSVFKPQKSVAAPVLVNGVVKNLANNKYKIIVRKGVLPVTGQAPVVANFTLELSVPGGADVADAEDLRAACSLLVGFLNTNSSALGDLLVSGVI